MRKIALKISKLILKSVSKKIHKITYKVSEIVIKKTVGTDLNKMDDYGL